ncbi:MAG: hypothetical protein K1X65_10035 [Caldilineales bacterium]|nr:hypothetical protein [Caldilineales bacterium]MCW5861175.1 hypothetical protein [Caldilineales bacterium]
MRLLEFGPIAAIRRNHAIEHATIHILSRMRPETNMAGRSNSHGFVIYGDLATETITQAVAEAIRRIRGGEARLAIHPNCGTNMVTTATLTTAATLLAGGMGRRRHWLDRIPTATIAALLAVFISQFVGPTLQQRVTTSASLGGVDVLEVQRKQFGSRVLHWVRLQHTPSADDGRA